MEHSDNEADSATATTPRKSTGHRRLTKQTPLEKETARDAASFINIETPEATIAAYCDINDVGTFRKFLISALVMPHYLKSLAYKGNNRRHVLSLLEDLPYDKYWASDDDAHVVYPAEDTTTRGNNLNYGLALVAWQCLRAIRKGLSVDTPKVDEDEFTKLTGCKLPKTVNPLSQDEVPALGPFGEELELEALNRCLCLFVHVKHTLSPSRWDRRFFAMTDWSLPRRITVYDQPEWMRKQEAVEREAHDETSGPPPAPVLEMRISWNPESKMVATHGSIVALLLPWPHSWRTTKGRSPQSTSCRMSKKKMYRGRCSR
jgi:hypothetical protein